MGLPKRILGKTGAELTIMGLGGEGVLRTYGYDRDAYHVINKALDLGITYLESARAYAGSETYYGYALRERRAEIFLASKSHARDKQGALNHLEETLKNMRTDHLDLWQVHDVRTIEDINLIFGPNGAIEAFQGAKQSGLVRFVGVTGHQDPDIILKCLEVYDFDTVLVPVNPAEPSFKSFLHTVVPAAVGKGMGIIGMKIYFRGLAAKLPGYSSVEPFFRFALSQAITTAVIGCDSVDHVEKNVSFARAFQPMTEEEIKEVVGVTAPFARQLMYYKP